MTIDENKIKKMDFFIQKYCSIDLSNYPKLDSYTIEYVLDDVIFTKNKNNGLIGIRYIDSSIKIDEIYNSISIINDSIFLARINGSEMLIDRKGNTILSLKNGKYYGYNEGYITVHNHFYYYGVIDTYGNEIIKCNVLNIKDTQKGFIIEKRYGYGVVDFKKKEIIKANYASINYKDGFYIVYNNKGKYGLKNSKGKKVFSEKYKYIMPFNGNLICAKDNEKIYIYTYNKELIYKFDKKEYYIYRYDDEIISFRNINKKHHITFHNFKPIVIECDFMSKYINDIAWIKKDNKYYLVNRDGNVISDEYDNACIKDEKIMLKKDNQLFYFDSSIKKLDKFDSYKDVLLKVSDDLVITNDNSSTSKFIFRDKTIIDTNENYTFAKKFGDYIICGNNTKNFLNALYTKDGKNIIPLIEDEIYVIGKNKVAINNHIIDLSVEYLNLDIKYNLLIKNNYDKIIKQFSNINEREEYINEIIKYQNELNKEIDYINNRVKEFEKIDLDSIDNKIIKKKKSK